MGLPVTASPYAPRPAIRDDTSAREPAKRAGGATGACLYDGLASQIFQQKGDPWTDHPRPIRTRPVTSARKGKS